MLLIYSLDATHFFLYRLYRSWGWGVHIYIYIMMKYFWFWNELQHSLGNSFPFWLPVKLTKLPLFIKINHYKNMSFQIAVINLLHPRLRSWKINESDSSHTSHHLLFVSNVTTVFAKTNNPPVPSWRLSLWCFLTCMNKLNLWSFFCLVLMSSSADGWLQQKVPTALFIFSSSSPLNWSWHSDTCDLNRSSYWCVKSLQTTLDQTFT